MDDELLLRFWLLHLPGSLSLSLLMKPKLQAIAGNTFLYGAAYMCMESLSRQLKELPTMFGSILHMSEEQHRLLPAVRLEEGVIHGHGGHGGHSGAIVDDVLAALPLLGRNHILPKVGEFSSESSAN